MGYPDPMLEWDDVRLFLAVAREGSLSAAARTLALTQPTVGRRMAALEQKLGAQLFRATPHGQMVTATGRRMRVHAERMEAAALAAERSATGRDAGLRGRVCITATEWMIDRVLAPLVASIVSEHGELEVELLADVRHLSLLRREADIAVRPSAFEHQDIVQRDVGRLAFALYASDGYLARHGVPDPANGCAGHQLIAMSESLTKIPDWRWLAASAAEARVVARANGRLPMVTLAVAGLGIACLPRVLGDAAPSLRVLAWSTSLPARTLWIGTHRDARAVPRVRTVARLLAQGLARLAPALSPATQTP